MVGEPDGINADRLSPFGVGADRLRTRHAEPPQTKANANFDGAHTKASLHKSARTLPDSRNVRPVTPGGCWETCANPARERDRVALGSPHCSPLLLVRAPRLFTTGARDS